jgi:hypothetical protein
MNDITDDARLSALRQDPSPEFAAGLRIRLRQQAERSAAPAVAWRMGRWATGVGAVAATALLFTIPAVRTSAQSFLALFRVVNFVAVPVDESRFQQLTSEQLDLPRLVGERLEVLEAPGPPTAAVSVSQAGEAAGIDVLEPAHLPPNAVLVGITVEGRSRARVTADADRLQQVMDTLGIDDLSVPSGLDGQVVDITVPPVVTLSYEQGQLLTARLRQVRTPDVLLPAGVNLQQLGEIGLRILGLPSQEARQFAGTIDWSSSLIVAIPPMASSFRQIEIDGQQGVMIQRSDELPGGGRRQARSLLLWSSGGRVLSLEGTIGSYELQLMANSLR